MCCLLKRKAINKECAVAQTALMCNLYSQLSTAQAYSDEVDEQAFSCSFKYLEQPLYSPHQSPPRLHPVRATPGILFISTVS